MEKIAPQEYFKSQSTQTDPTNLPANHPYAFISTFIPLTAPMEKERRTVHSSPKKCQTETNYNTKESDMYTKSLITHLMPKRKLSALKKTNPPPIPHPFRVILHST